MTGLSVKRIVKSPYLMCQAFHADSSHDKITLILRSGLAMYVFEGNTDATLNMVTAWRRILGDLHILHQEGNPMLVAFPLRNRDFSLQYFDTEYNVHFSIALVEPNIMSSSSFVGISSHATSTAMLGHLVPK